VSLLWRFSAFALLLAATTSASALGRGADQPLAVTSSIDGQKVLPQQGRWLAHPNVAAARIREVDFLIDGKMRWVEHSAPYVYGGDDNGANLGYLFTSWLAPGEHTFTARVVTNDGHTATDRVNARVVPAPPPPTGLAGTWTRILTAKDRAKADPKYGADNVPPAGRWRLVVDRVGVWELDPLGTGIVQAYSVSGTVLHSYAPIEMVPRKANGDPGEIKRFGSRIDAGGGIDCTEAGPPGTYRLSVMSNQLKLTALREPCGQRRAVYEGTWTRVR
jgi:hypothetical protein